MVDASETQELGPPILGELGKIGDNRVLSNCYA